SVVDDERGQRPVVDGSDQLFADRGRSDLLRGGFSGLADLDSGTLEHLPEICHLLSVIEETIGLRVAASSYAFNVGGNLEVRLSLLESFFQWQRVGFGEVGRCRRQDEPGLPPPLLAPKVIRASQGRLDGFTSLSFSLRLCRLAGRLQLLQPKACP